MLDKWRIFYGARHESKSEKLSTSCISAVDSSAWPASPTGLIYGVGRATSRVSERLPTRCRPAGLFSVCHIWPSVAFSLAHHSRACAVLVFSPKAFLGEGRPCYIHLPSNGSELGKHSSTFASDILSPSVEKAKRRRSSENPARRSEGEFIRVERVTLHGGRVPVLNERWPPERELLQCHHKADMSHFLIFRLF